MNQNLTVALLCVLLLTNCKQQEKKDTPAENSRQAIRPLLPGVTRPDTTYTVTAEQGDTLVYKSGSIILFPTNAFVDKDGKPVSGKVQVKYREFDDPVDIYLSGIPMGYDSAGHRYTFESSAMFQLLAYQDGVPVFVNPKNQPEVFLSDKRNLSNNIYYFDTLAERWIGQGIASSFTIGEVQKYRESKGKLQRPIIAASPSIVRPRKANGKGPVIRVMIDSTAFSELSAYDNLKFQLDTSKQKFSPADSKEEWNDIKLEKGNSEGSYIIKLKNTNRSVEYNAYPVFEGKDYDAAMKVFNEKLKRAGRGREKYLNDIKKEEAARAQSIQDSIDNNLVERYNRLIEARNRRIMELNISIEEKNRINSEFNLAGTALKAIPVTGFWTYNLDKVNQSDVIPVVALFRDKNGKDLSLTNIAVMVRDINLMWKFRSNSIKLIRGRDNMIVGIYEGQVAYLSYKKFKNYNFQDNPFDQVFVMELVPRNKNNFDDLRIVLSQ